MSSKIQYNDSLSLENQNLKQQVDLLKQQIEILKIMVNKNNTHQQFLNEENMFLKKQLEMYEKGYYNR
jgi:hypothetical protein